MVVACGSVEVNELNNVEAVAGELKRRGLEVNEIEEVKIVFFIEKETIGAVKSELASLKDIEAVKTVHLAYYSLEDADEGPELESSKTGKL
jgi:nitrate reductase NapAB chaperone NapD